MGESSSSSSLSILIFFSLVLLGLTGVSSSSSEEEEDHVGFRGRFRAEEPPLLPLPPATTFLAEQPEAGLEKKELKQWRIIENYIKIYI